MRKEISSGDLDARYIVKGLVVAILGTVGLNVWRARPYLGAGIGLVAGLLIAVFVPPRSSKKNLLWQIALTTAGFVALDLIYR